MSDADDNLLDGLRNGTWLHQQQFPELAFHVPEVIPEGSILFVGPPKVGKSWWLLGTGLAIASGGKALGDLDVEQRPVLYLALEDGDRRLQSRCRILLGPTAPIPAAFEYMTRVRPGLVVPTIRAWMGSHPGAKPLVMLDTLGKVMPPTNPGESAYQRDYRVGSALKELADDHPGSAVLVNHHDRKAGADDFVDSVSGTHGLAGAADTIVVLSRARHETVGSIKVTGRDVEENEYALELSNGGVWTLVGNSLASAAAAATQKRATAGLADRTAEIFAFVSQHPGGVRAGEVEDKFGADSRRYLSRMADAGRLVRKARGLYTAVPSVPLSQDQGSGNGTTGRMGHALEGDPDVCERCKAPTARLVLGRCPACAYPAGGDPDEADHAA